MRIETLRSWYARACAGLVLLALAGCSTSRGGGQVEDPDLTTLPDVVWRQKGDSGTLWLSPNDPTPVANIMIVDDMQALGVGRLSRDFMVIPASASNHPSPSGSYIGPCYREAPTPGDPVWIKCLRIKAEEAFQLDPERE